MKTSDQIFVRLTLTVLAALFFMEVSLATGCRLSAPHEIAAPTFSPEGGRYTSNQIVSITCVTPQVTICYTMDGSEPTPSNGSIYSTQFAITSTTRLRAVAFDSDLNCSGVTEATFTIVKPKLFWAARVTDGSWYTLQAVKKAAGTYCDVYVETAQTTAITDEQAASIALEFDQNIYTKIRDKFGTESDVDSNGKVLLLLMDIQDGYSGSGGYVGGYFAPINEIVDPHSNSCEMLYLDCNPGTPATPDFYQIIAHEFQHMINFNQKYFVQGGHFQDTWINEGLSSAAETVYSGGFVDWKIDYYNADPNTVIRLGQGFVAWTPSWGDPLASYSTVYLFFQRLRILSSNGDNIYKEITASSYDDYRAVEAVENVRLYTGVWKDYLRDWYLANLINDPTNKYGYRGQITLSPNYLTGASGEEFPLASGEAVYVPIASSAVMTPAQPVDYVGVIPSTASLSVTGPTYTGSVLLCYNYSGDPDAPSYHTSALPAVTVPIAPRSMIPIREPGRTAYPIDVAYDQIAPIKAPAFTPARTKVK